MQLNLAKASTATLLEEASRILNAPGAVALEYICDVAGELRRRKCFEIEDRLLVSAAKFAIQD